MCYDVRRTLRMRVNTFALTLLCALALPPREGHAQESQLDGYQAAAKSSPSDPAAALALGRALRRAGRPALSLAELRRGIGIAASRPDVLLQLHWEVARVDMDRHDLPQTLTECKLLGALPGAGAEGHACAAQAHLLWQRATEALGETAAALTKDPKCYEAKIAEARAYELELDATRAEASLRGALALKPDGVDAHVGLGRVLVRGGRRNEGVLELRKAVALDPNGPEPLFELAAALGPGPETIALLEHATRERPSFAAAWLALGGDLLAAGRVTEAGKAAGAAVRHDPASVPSRVLLGKVALAENRPDDAINEGEAVLRLLPNSAAGKLLVADGNAKKGEIDAALEAYQAAWGLDHGDPAPLVRASEACHAAGRDTSARAFGVKATQEFPAWAPGWVALGDALVGQGERAAARDAYQKALGAEGPVDRAAVQRKMAALP
jgi:tetratricopeptide (TPR) repeat protein